MVSAVIQALGRALRRRRGEPATGEPSAGEGAVRPPQTFVVDAARRGGQTTITGAIAAAAAGDRILVRPGRYRERLVVDKALEIAGDGMAGTVTVEATGTSTLLITAASGRITNLSLVQQGPGAWSAVEIRQGRPEVVDCDLTGQGAAVVTIRGGADPLLRGNRIHGGSGDGILVCDNARGTIESNEITGNAGVGVRITTGSAPTLRRNRVHEGKGNGVYVDGAGGLLEENEVFDNRDAEVAITTGGDPTLRRNRIHNGMGDGVVVWHHGEGSLEENEIFANARAGLVIRSGGNPTVRRNRITRNAQVGVRVQDAGAGTVEDNDLTGNALGPWDVTPDCEPTLTRAGNRE